MSIDGSHRIISVEISGGFLDGMFFDFNAGLNCINENSIVNVF